MPLTVAVVDMGASLRGAQRSILPGRERIQDFTLSIGICSRLKFYKDGANLSLYRFLFITETLPLSYCQSMGPVNLE